MAPASKRAPARRKAPARKRAAARKPARRSSIFSGGMPRLPVLDQRERDVLGLAIIALGVFMGFVLYGSGAPAPGGRAGHALAVGSGWALGRARVLAPVTLFVGGGALLLRPVLPAVRPLRTGALCVFAGVTLALAAGALAPAAGSAGRPWSSEHMQAHGGLLGEALYRLLHPLAQGVGVGIVVAFLLVAGILLLTGASLAAILRATGHGLRDTTRVVRRMGAGGRALHPGPDPRRELLRDLDAEPALHPPDPDPAELVVRATHVEAPSRDWMDEPPEQEELAAARELLADEAQEAPPAAAEPPEEVEEEEQIAGVAQADPADLTPQGRLRGAVTDDPDFVWELPDASRLLTRSTGEQTRPDTAGQERTATALVEALGHFGVQAKLIGTVAGPHITRYELRLAPGIKVGKVAQLKDD